MQIMLVIYILCFGIYDVEPHDITSLSLTQEQNLVSQNVKPPFESNEVINRVRSYHDLSESRDGEFLIDTNVVYVPAEYYQWCPSIAFDGTNYLVIWQDLRNGSSYNIYGARVSQSGTILDPAGFSISANEYTQWYSSVAFGTANYLVIWEEGRSSSSSDIYGTRVNQAGIVLDPEGIAISPAADYQRYPSVAFNGTNYLVVWQDYHSGSLYDIYGARVNQAGIVLDPEGIAISTAAQWQEYPAVAFDGTNYLVVWGDHRPGHGICGARISQSGNVIDTVCIIISAFGGSPSVAFDGTNYLVAWYDARNSSYDIYGARVSQAGVVLDPEGIPISTEIEDQFYPSVAFNDTNYLVVWQDSRTSMYPDIYGARVTQSGAVLDPEGIAISTSAYGQYSTAIASNGSDYLIVWDGPYLSSLWDIYGTRVNQAGVNLDTTEIAISSAANLQKYPSVAFDGTNYLIVWQDDRSGEYPDIYGMQLNQSGVALDTNAIAISTDSIYQEYPSIAFDGTNYLVVWQDSRSGYSYDIYGARVSQSGTILDTVGIGIAISTSHDQEYPSVVFDGTNYLVVWDRFDGVSSDIYGARVNQSGVVLDTEGIAISTAESWGEYPSVTFDGINYFIVWDNGDIYGARVNQSGIVLDTSGIVISTGAYWQYHPSVAFDGTNYIVVWQDNRNGDWDIYGARVNQSGFVLDTAGIAISTAPDSQVHPAVIFDGIDYLVVWEDWRNGSESDIYGAKVSPSGTVINTYAISNQPGNQITPALAHGSADSVLIAYSGWADSINNHPANTMRIWGKFYPFVGVEENAGFRIQDKGFGLMVYPNPFDRKTDIRYQPAPLRGARPGITDNSKAELKIYDVTGRLVRQFNQLTNNQLLINQVTWDGNDDYGRKLPAGIYFVHIHGEGFAEVKKIIKVK